VAVGASVVARASPIRSEAVRLRGDDGATERQKGIIEWQSPNFADPAMWVLLALLVSFAALTVIVLSRPSLRRHFELRDFALAAVGAGLALTSVRNTAICVAVMIPPWIAMAAGVVRSLETRRAQRSSVARSRHASPVMGIVLLGRRGLRRRCGGCACRPERVTAGIAAAYPACATALLARSPTTQRVFTAYGTGGYVIYRLWPRASVYEYGESISLGTAVFDDYLRVAAGDTTTPTALQLLASSGTTAVLYSKGALTDDSARRLGGRWLPTTTGCSSTCGEMRRGRPAHRVPLRHRADRFRSRRGRSTVLGDATDRGDRGNRDRQDDR